MDNTVLTKRIFERLLREAGAPDVSKLAGCVSTDGTGGYKKALVLYDIDKMMDILDETPMDDSGISEEALYSTIVGYVRIEEPLRSTPCNGAWEVVRAAGHGYGKVLYGSAYAMSPNGAIMPDRQDVSDTAAAAWEKTYRSHREKKKLDDVEHPETPDPSDDCRVYSEYMSEDPLNFSYEAEGWESGMLKKLLAAHKEVMGEVEALGMAADVFEGELQRAGRLFFTVVYDDAN